ncbi:MAG TPA: vWA domain-containing protein [Bryobacteraceae bacterium]|nr:vWA domain-containing protein [Bryobacteraceae bacterium]
MTNARNKRSRGYAVLLLAVLALTLIPLAGLAIDCAILYIVKARISAACDAAALAAARNLSLGQTLAEQEATARARALSFYNANFAENFLGATRLPPTITIPPGSVNNVLNITVSGSARVRTYFMGMLRGSNIGVVNVAATGTAARRDVKMMLVLDRSSSLDTSGDCDLMKSKSSEFVGRFADGRDTIGLVVFGTNMVVIPPSQTFMNRIQDTIEDIDCGENTSASMAYWRAYEELVNSNPMPAALNTIVFFTDGIPNGIWADFDVRNASGNRFGYREGPCGHNDTCPIPASTCSNPGNRIRGVLVQWGDNQPRGAVAGLFEPVGAQVTDSAPRVARAGCAFSANGNHAEKVRKDLRFIPDVDAQSNRIRNYPIGYSQYKQFVTNPDSDFDIQYPNQIRLDRPSTIAKASSNLLDYGAQRVRNRALNSQIGVVTYVIGLGSRSLPIQQQPDDVLLARVANDPGDPYDASRIRSPIYVDDPLLSDGMYIRATNDAEMSAAFHKIASELLRLTK